MFNHAEARHLADCLCLKGCAKAQAARLGDEGQVMMVVNRVDQLVKRKCGHGIVCFHDGTTLHFEMEVD